MPSTYSSVAYTATAQLNGIDKRTLTTTNPAAGSTATQGIPTGSLAGTDAYLRPETALAAGGATALQPVGTAQGTGWALIPSANGVTPLSQDGFTMTSFGTASVVIRANRTNPLASGNLTTTFTVIFFRANSNATVFYEELARGTLTGAVITTTLTDFTVSVSSSGSAVFAPGDVIWMEIHASQTSGSVVTSQAVYTTNLNTGTRVTFGFTYTKQFARSVSDSAAISDAVLRTYVGNRALSDNSALQGDTITRAFTGARSISDARPVTDSMSRAFTGSRAMSESMPVADSLARAVVAARTLTDLVSVVDAVTRTYTARRAVQDALSPVADSILRQFTASRSISDSLTPIFDSLARRFTGNRSLADGVSVSDFIARQTTYRRTVLDELSTGGGGTTIIRRKRVTIFDKA